MDRSLNYQNARFLTSVPDMSHLPADEGKVEVAFAGLSNTGKSSAINRLTNQKHLAKAGKVAGKTQLINLFEVSPGCTIVDLPGYGYARVPVEIKKRWQESLDLYIKKRGALKGVVILMDIRHPLKALDQRLISQAVSRQLPIQLLLTKSDKLRRTLHKSQLIRVQRNIKNLGTRAYVDIFSSRDSTGISALRSRLNRWYSLESVCGVR